MKTMQLFLLICVCAPALFAMTTADDVKGFTLENGMKFLVLEDHSIPNANMYLFWKVGSRNEVPGITGLSHFFEHMMFNGAKKYGPKMFDRVMEANGGANNAYTSEDVTVYTDFFPSGAMEIIFELEADRIGNLALDDKMVESERGVVLSERITYMNNSNWMLLSEQVKSVAFMAHPYRWEVIGYESDIKAWTKDDLQDYFDTYYAPNNALVVMVGNITVDGVKALAEKYFGPIPANTPPPPVRTVEPEQLGEKRLTVKKDVSSPNLMIVWHIPQAKSEDYYPLELFHTILSQGKSSRLYSALVDEKQLATEVSAYMPAAFDPNLYYVYAVCAKDVHETDLEPAIYEEIDDLITNGVSEHELQKAKNRKVVEFYREMETINGKANTIGTYELFFGDYKKLFAAPDLYAGITARDVQKVAAKYFVQSNRTVGTMKKAEEVKDETE